METPRRDILSSIGLLILRLGIAGYLLTHGWGKVQDLLAGRYEMYAGPLGLSGWPTLALLVFAEFFCALLVMAGAATRFAAVPVVIAMSVAAFWAHWNDPWTMGEAFRLFFEGQTQYPASKQPALMFLVVFLTLIFTGPGRFSIDALIWPRASGRTLINTQP